MSLFISPHLGGDRMSDEEIDQMHDQMLANEGHMFDQVMRGRAGPPVRMSVHPPSTTRSMPWDWLGEEGQEAEIMNSALED
jgi:hypothetical protein